MAQEIERKFLLQQAPSIISENIRYSIIQGYLPISVESTEIRVRSIGRSPDHIEYRLTVKSGNGLVRFEREECLPEELFCLLWPLTEKRRVSKKRYCLYPDDDHKLEVDCFNGPLYGLVIAEVEFASTEAAQAFTLPGYCQLAREVTGDERYLNKNLALIASAEEMLQLLP